MLDLFLKVAYARSEKEKAVRKIAGMGMGGGGKDWLEKYKSTPLLPKALMLAQQEIELEQQDMQQRDAREEEMDSSRQLWKMRDALCLQKRMLDLELASVELSLAMPTAPPPVAMAPEPPPEAVEAAAPPEGVPAAPKMAAARMRMKLAAEKVKPATGLTAQIFGTPTKEQIRLLQKLRDKQEAERKAGGSGLFTHVSAKKASVDEAACQMRMRKEAIGLLDAGQKLYQAAAKGYGPAAAAATKGAKSAKNVSVPLSQRLGGAMREGASEFANIAKESPFTAAGLVAAPAAAAGAVGLGAGYLAGR